MTIFELNAETSGLSIEHLLKQVGEDGVQVRNAKGHIVALVFPPRDHEALTYAEAHLDLNEHLDQVRQALGRQGGVTTAELLGKAVLAAKTASR
jgi:hypothetical protein